MANEIKLVKLINGETVLGKWDEDANKLKDVAVIQTVPTQQGAQMLILPFGYPFESELSGEISGEHVLYVYKSTPKELETKYLEASSNLTLSTASDLQNLERMAGGQENISDFAAQLLKK